MASEKEKFTFYIQHLPEQLHLVSINFGVKYHVQKIRSHIMIDQ